MYDFASLGPKAASSKAPNEDLPEFVPSIDTDEIFRRLIADELRAGRLTRARRRSIVQYAAQMGLSAVQAGRLIAACRDEALRSRDPIERRCAFRLVDPPPARVPTPLKIAMVIAAAIVLDLLVVYWLW